jgi:hypothetical protein
LCAATPSRGWPFPRFLGHTAARTPHLLRRCNAHRDSGAHLIVVVVSVGRFAGSSASLRADGPCSDARAATVCATFGLAHGCVGRCSRPDRARLPPEDRRRSRQTNGRRLARAGRQMQSCSACPRTPGRREQPCSDGPGLAGWRKPSRFGHPVCRGWQRKRCVQGPARAGSCR